jgi:hypothetical protein
MEIFESWPRVEGVVRYLLRDRCGKITVDLEGTDMTGFTCHGYEGDEDKAMKKAFKFLESAGW